MSSEIARATVLSLLLSCTSPSTNLEPERVSDAASQEPAGVGNPSPLELNEPLFETMLGGPQEFRAFVARMKTREAQLLAQLRSEEDQSKRGDIEIVLALLCVEVPSSEFFYLREYRCGNRPFSSLAGHAASVFFNLPVVALAKQEDQRAARAFLLRYLEFWTSEPADGAVIGEANLEEILELVLFLEQGGFP